VIQKLPNARVQQRGRPARSAGLARTLRVVGRVDARDATRAPVCCNAMLGAPFVVPDRGLVRSSVGGGGPMGLDGGLGLGRFV